jgi:ribosomal protein L11 methyltransferase
LSTSPATSANTSHPLTYSLTITIAGPTPSTTKEDVKGWLVMQGIDSFVEGLIDHCDIPDESGIDKEQLFSELGGDEGPIILYSYDAEWLQGVGQQLLDHFAPAVSWQLGSLPTAEWQEGWKDSFRPITTERFYLYPPWDEGALPAGKLPLIINPGMAFGTGQHATTQLCLETIETLHQDISEATRVLDVGTGSGILAIAARKLGYPQVDACDIDPDALLAVEENCTLNQIDGIHRWQGSIMPTLATAEHRYQLIFANILFPVLEELLPHLAALLAKDGLLLISGILVEQEAEMLALAKAARLQLQKSINKDSWSCLVLHPKH